MRFEPEEQSFEMNPKQEDLKYGVELLEDNPEMAVSPNGQQQPPSPMKRRHPPRGSGGVGQLEGRRLTSNDKRAIERPTALSYGQ